MVDRYRSFLDESVASHKKGNKSSLMIESQINQYDKYIKLTERYANGMKKCIDEYRRALTPEE